MLCTYPGHKPDHAFAYWKGELAGLRKTESCNVKIADEILGEETEENNDR